MAFEIQFPDADQAEDDGLVAIGGNLSVDFLLAAYSQGLFPWFNTGEPILWWSPNPRMLLYPKEFKCSKSLQQIINRNKFKIKIDENFEEVIQKCASVKREKQTGTWISKEIIEAYVKLHNEGYAHSFETYLDGKLAGGLYGISLGKAFFGESMFYHVKNASKVALYFLTVLMLKWDYHFIDVQQSTQHLRSMGAKNVDRREFLELLKKALKFPTKKEKWKFSFNK
ncbi:Leucyl/phenylalanyl-tRNA--protein transferase [subsurface metagenome]